MKQIILRYGLISGIIGALLMLAMTLYMRNDPTRFANAEYAGMAGIILSMIIVYFGVRAYRDQVGAGPFSFFQGFQVGLFITLISSVFYVVTWMIVYHTMMPDFMDKFMEYSLNKMKNAGASSGEIAEKMADMAKFKEMYKNPLLAAAITLVEPFPIGLVITLVSAALLRRA